MALRPTSAARTSDRRAGFTLVEAAVALAVAALFCAAVAVAVSLLLREHAAAERRLEAALWHQTLFARRALERDPLDGPPPAAGWTTATDTAPLPAEAPAANVERFVLSPADRPSMTETLELPAKGR